MSQPGDPFSGDFAEDFGDLFAQLFGGAAPAGRRSRDITQPLTVGFDEALEGARHDVEVSRFHPCEVCDGRGAPADAASAPCEACAGEGGVSRTQGFFSIRTTCAECHGRGVRHERACDACAGAGGRSVPERVEVVVPGGVQSGQRLRLAGKGNDLRDGQGPGDLYLALVVGADERLTRDGADVRATVRLSPALAAEGGVVKAPVPGGEVDLKVPPGTTTGREVRLRGFGAQRLGAPPAPRPSPEPEPYRSVEPSEHRGDLVVTFWVEGDRPPEMVHFETLGLPPTATHAEVAQAYRAEAMRWHPDRNPPGDPAAARRFAEVGRAFAALRGRGVTDERLEDELARVEGPGDTEGSRGFVILALVVAAVLAGLFLRGLLA